MRIINYLLFPALLMSVSCRKEEVVRVEEIHNDTVIVNRTEYNAEFVISGQEPVTDNIMPVFLHSGDRVAICASSNSVTEADIQEAVQILQQWGLQVQKSDNLLSVDNRYAGTLEERINGFQNAVDDPEVRAIFMSRGGYGAAQLLPFIDWQGMYDSPKWLIGYSDVTALHIALNNMGFNTIHGPMMKGFSKDRTSMENLRKMLFGEAQPIEISSNPQSIHGKASGRLVGGNLSLIYALGGTAFDLNTMDAILFIEDTGESNYSIDRMLLNLKQSGKLDKIRGVIVGEFIGNTQGSDLPLHEIFHKYLAPLGIPLVYGLPSGHDTQNLPLMLGARVEIQVDGSSQRIVPLGNAAL